MTSAHENYGPGLDGEPMERFVSDAERVMLDWEAVWGGQARTDRIAVEQHAQRARGCAVGRSIRRGILSFVALFRPRYR